MIKPSRRNAGLDTLRALAITLVFLYHYLCFVSDKPSFGWVGEVGWTGVDLFFVLSGYLISNQLFKGIAAGQVVSTGRFYLRRAFRTLPVFWLVLAVYWLFPGEAGGKAPPPLWRFLTFTHNIGLQPGTAFSHAWSLSVEEQFYFVLPLVLAAGAALASARLARIAPSRRTGWMLLAAMVLVGVASRAALWCVHGRKSGGHVDGYMTAIYYSTLCRFDEFAPGIAIAMLKNFHPARWARMMERGNGFLGMGAAATLAMLVVACNNWVKGYGYPFFMTTFGYSLLAMAFALLVVAALSPRTALHGMHIPGADKIALWSYSIYLSHRPLANMLVEWMKPLALSDWAQFSIIAISCVGAGALLYELVESPFMTLRDRWVPSNFVPRAVLSDSSTARLHGSVRSARESVL
jgi:peptidoglycan/LPS O-acetylase OafA/YrhL